MLFFHLNLSKFLNKKFRIQKLINGHFFRMANLIEGILKDFDEEFGSGSNLEQFSSAHDANDFSARHQNNSNIQNTFTQQQSVLNETQLKNQSNLQNTFSQQQPIFNEPQPKGQSNLSFKYQVNNPNSTQQFNSYNNILSENTFQDEEQQMQSLPSQQGSASAIKINKISVEEATQIINDLKQERIKDARKMQQLQTENARLVAKMTILEHTDLKVAELGSRVEQLLQKYLESEQIRAQQAAQISQLRQEVIVLKSRISQVGGQLSSNQRISGNSINSMSNF